MIRFSGITKRFGGVHALSDVSFDIRAGSCHAVCGENGAGKSTLGKILAGIERADSGTIEIDGLPLSLASPRDARGAGIAMVHQELMFCENLSVAENLCLGALPRHGAMVDRSACEVKARELLAAVGATIDPRRPMRSLTPAEQQLAQIAAAVGEGAKVIVFDEPTSSLDQHDADRLYELIAELKLRGTTLLYVSHRMPEIFRLCDEITVLRDGRHVSTQPAALLDETTLVQQMIGRRVADYFPASGSHAEGAEILRLDKLSSDGKFTDVSFSIRAGEVLGLAGLVGAGRTQIADSIFGLDRATRGTISVRGERRIIRSPRDAMRLGIGFVPEDRKRLGLVLSMTAGANVTLPTLRSVARAGWIDRRRERAAIATQFTRLQVRAETSAPVASLSGGNQQKIVVAKWLAGRSDLLMLDEPTRGVDVGAKAELHAWIDQLASEGKAVLLISSELPELLALSTRIIVLRNGRVVGEQSREHASQDGLMRLMAGVDL
jgi:ABC-type sugar transport system ATPase subunit